MNELIMITGLPGCGKSTYRAPYLDVLSTDDFIEAIADANGLTYNEVFQQSVKSAEVCMYAHMETLVHHDVRQIVWDQTNLTAKTRKRKLDQFNQAGGKHYRKISLFFEPDLQLSIERNEERRSVGRGIPLHIIENMFGQIETPKKSEGFDYVFHVPVDSQV
jgi:predicted kinase